MFATTLKKFEQYVISNVYYQRTFPLVLYASKHGNDNDYVDKLFFWKETLPLWMLDWTQKTLLVVEKHEGIIN